MKPNPSGVDPGFWSGQRVLLTGHTGFKGGWAALWLARMGAAVTGIALPPETDPNLFTLAGIASVARSHFADIRDLDALSAIVARADPQIVLHMAAQPLVRRAIAEPVATFDVNLRGTVHLLQALRQCASLACVLVVTTDKVYANHETGAAFREDDALGGLDPYAASKAAAELATQAMARSYFDDAGIPVATARAGNVIGGGDFAADRLIPDIVRAVVAGTPLSLRNPDSTRPWQHVLDCLAGYFCFAQALARRATTRRALNFGPPADPTISVRMMATAMLKAFGRQPVWETVGDAGGHEQRLLAIDSSAARAELGWRDRLAGGAALAETAAWYRAWADGGAMQAITLAQIDAYRGVAP